MMTLDELILKAEEKGVATMSKCNCMYEGGEHKTGMGKCPYGDAAIFPHPDGVRRKSEKANAVLDTLVCIAESRGFSYPSLATALHSTPSEVVGQMRRMPKAKLVELVKFHFSGA